MKSKSYVFAVLAVISTFAMSAEAANYCMAIRGNGELEPAHWGAISKVIEKLGLPEKQAGGSSASITMLLIDAIASNPLVKTASARRQAARAALMVKSLQGFLNDLSATPEWQDFLALYQQVEELKDTKWSGQIKQMFAGTGSLDPEQAKAFLAANGAKLESTYETGKKLGLINPQSYAPLFTAIQRLEQGGLSDRDLVATLATAEFYSQELYDSISFLGTYNAQTDSGVFFRPGVIDFSKLADQFGRVADFYSMESAAVGEPQLWKKFLNTCADPAQGLTWTQLVSAHPECAQAFSATMKLHFSANSNSNFALHDIGVSIPSFPTTAVLVGSAHREALAAEAQYFAKMDRSIGQNFKPSNSKAVHFGYWGREDLLARIKSHLDPNDEKSSRFKSLGMATWQTVLGLSPAEPGLSPLKTFMSKGQEVSSAGGWSDLHPVLLLKAAGCTNVVYVTRRGGESLFGQGVAKRLLGYDRDWNLITTAAPTAEAQKAVTVMNNSGDPSDMTSLWSKLYNLANPKSSFKTALYNAAAVLCTNWDSFEITQGVEGMISDSYSSPFYVPANSGLRSQGLSPLLNVSEQSADGFPTFAGCY